MRLIRFVLVETSRNQVKYLKGSHVTQSPVKQRDKGTLHVQCPMPNLSSINTPQTLTKRNATITFTAAGSVPVPQCPSITSEPLRAAARTALTAAAAARPPRSLWPPCRRWRLVWPAVRASRALVAGRPSTVSVTTSAAPSAGGCSRGARPSAPSETWVPSRRRRAAARAAAGRASQA